MKTKSPLISIVFLLIFIGIFFIGISSLTEASTTLGDPYYFIKKQTAWVSIGLVMFYISSKISLEFIKKQSVNFYILSIATLVLVLIPGLGSEALGARRWLNLGFTSIQPSEILKLSSTIYFAYLFSKDKNKNIKNLIFYLAVPFFLIIIQPNLSTAILISLIVISVYYVAGGEIRGLFSLSLIALLLSLVLIIFSPYRYARFKTLIDPDANANSSYHSNQIILALASGGLTGKGFANSETKYRFLPKLSTDSILAVIGEETGFIGLSFILLLYISLIVYMFKLSQSLEDKFHSLLVAAVASWISYQTLINLSAIVAIIPLTGVPLPFISYGGSSMLSLFIALGLVKNVENHNKLLINNNRTVKLKQSHETNQKDSHRRNTSHSRN